MSYVYTQLVNALYLYWLKSLIFNFLCVHIEKCYQNIENVETQQHI